MIHPARERELIDLHATLRKQAFALCVDPVIDVFREADTHLAGVKTAAEIARTPPGLLRHLTTP